jgi:hypothetical protein
MGEVTKLLASRSMPLETLAPEESARIAKLIHSILWDPDRHSNKAGAKWMKAEMEAYPGRPSDLTAYLGRLVEVNEKAESHVDIAEVFGWCKPPSNQQPGITKVTGKRKFDDMSKSAKPGEVTAPPVAKPCHGCGRVHPGVCKYKDHPDYNRQAVPWAQSKQGIAWLKLDPKQKRLHPGRRLTPDMKSSVPYAENKVSPLNILAVTTSEANNECVVIGRLNAVDEPLRVLLDSGSSGQTGNYIREDCWQRIANEMQVCSCKKEKICGSNDKLCIESNKCTQVDITLQHDNDTVHIAFMARVMESLPYDIIVGWNTIKNNRLTTIFKKLFHDETDDRQQVLAMQEATSEIVKNKAQSKKSLVHKSELLDVEEDDDYVDDFLREEDDVIDFAARNDNTANIQYKIFGSTWLQNEIHKEIISVYKNCLSHTLKREPARVAPFELYLTNPDAWYGSKAHKQPPRPQSAAKEQAIREFIESALQADIIEECPHAQAWSQVLLTPKANGKWRFCVDYRALNSLTKSMGWPIPNIQHLLRRIGDRRPTTFGVIDLTQGYHQVLISVNSRDLTAFRTSAGIYRWKRLPMGLKGAPSFFQHQMMSTVLANLLYKICEVYLDDIIIYAEDESTFVHNVRQVFQRLQKFNITVNPEKMQLGMPEVEYLGHVINSKGLDFSKEKREEVLNFRLPETQKTLRSFLGLAGYFRDHVQQYAEKAKPLQSVVHNYTPHKKIAWTEELKEAFIVLKNAVHGAPMLYFMSTTAPVIMETDASQYGIGAYLYQKVDEVDQPVAILSKTLTAAETRWSTIEKEAYAIFYAFRKWEHLVRDIHFTLRTDHKNLTFINIDHREKVRRWKLAIQHYDFDIEHIHGRDNVVADGLSRLCPFPEGEAGNRLMVIQSLEDRWDDEVKEPTETGSAGTETTRQTIRKYHNSTVGHRGIERTYQTMLSDAAITPWAGMRKDIEEFIKNCVICQKVSHVKQMNNIQPFTLASYAPMHRIAVDTIGPINTTTEGYRHILVIIDAFSRYCRLYPIKDTTAQGAAEALVDWVCTFGIPHEMVNDNGPQFANRLITQLRQQMDIEAIPIHAYSHEENAIVERANKEVLRHLRAICFDKKIRSQWRQALPLVQRIINAQVHRSIGVSPSQIIFGNAIDLDRGLVRPQEIEDDKIVYEKYITDMLQLQAETIRAAQACQKEQDQFHIAQRGGKEITEFPINSYVLVQYENDEHMAPSKLHTKWRGPLQVVKNVGAIYTLRNLVTDKWEDFHVKLMKPFHYDSSEVDPTDIALHDEEFHIIESIKEHRFRGPQTYRTNLQFLVKWKNEAKPSWHKWSLDLARNEIVINYLKIHGLQRFVNKRYEPRTAEEKDSSSENQDSHNGI